MAQPIDLLDVSPIPLAVVRLRAGHDQLSTVIPQACGEVWNFIRVNGLQGAGRHVAIYLDDQINIECGVELPGGFASDGRVVASATPAGRVVTTAHIGPYHLLGDAHRAIHAWCTDHNLKPAGPSWEIYGHWTDDETKLRTDVFYLVG